MSQSHTELKVPETRLLNGPDTAKFLLFSVDIHADAIAANMAFIRDALKGEKNFEKVCKIFNQCHSEENIWGLFESWVKDNLPDDSSNAPNSTAALIYLAFHQSQDAADNKNNYDIYMEENGIVEEYKKQREAENAPILLSKASGSLLNKAVEMLLVAYYEKKDNKLLNMIKQLLYFVAGFYDTAGVARPHAYFLLGEIALFEGTEKSVLLAFDFFVFYLFALPAKTKIVFRENTIRSHAAKWRKRHPKISHPLIEMIESHDAELYENNEYLRKIVIKKSLNEEALHQACSNAINMSVSKRGAKKKSEDEIEWISVGDAIRSLNLPDFRKAMSSLGEIEGLQHNGIVQYAMFKNACMELIKKIRVITLGIENAATIGDKKDDDYIIFCLNRGSKIEVYWELTQQKASAPLFLAETIIRALSSIKGKNSQTAIKIISNVKQFLNNINAKITSTLSIKKQVAALRKALNEAEQKLKKLSGAYSIVAELSSLSGCEMSEPVILNFQDLSQKALNYVNQGAREEEQEQKEQIIQEGAMLKVGDVPVSSNYKAYDNVVQADAKTGEQSIPVQNFMSFYNSDSESGIFRWFKSRHLTSTTPIPEARDIVRHAMANPYRYWGLCGNRTARILHDKYGVDVSKLPSNVTASSLKSFGSDFYNEFKKICEADQPKLDKFHTAYNDKLSNECLPMRVTHKKEENKTFVRIVEETKHRTFLSYLVPWFFPSHNRSRKILEEQGVLKSNSSPAKTTP